MEIVLSNTTTFFGGRIEAIFKKAKKYGFKYLEIAPYRWLQPERVLKLEKQYGIEVAGIHMPQHWNRSAWQVFKAESAFLEKLFSLLWYLYMSQGAASPGLKLAELLQKQGRRPYLLFHTNVIQEMGRTFDTIAQQFHTVIENIPYEKNHLPFLWNPLVIKREMRARNLTVQLVFDHAHYLQNFNPHPPTAAAQVYRQTKPEVVHIGYVHPLRPPHALPNKQEQAELKQMLTIHLPKYIVIETNPAVNVREAKEMVERIMK